MIAPMTGEIDATRLLHRLCAGDEHARDEFAPLVHAELKSIAARHMRNERANHTLAPTELVHDAWVKLIHPDARAWENRRQFFALASRMMRSLLVDHARRRGAERRGGGRGPVTLSLDPSAPAADAGLDVLALDEAIEKLAEIDEQLARIAELRIFGGLEASEIAAQTDTSLRTTERRWRAARAWLTERLSEA